eukprot:767283-Hanusia_phi.AAC.2
MGSDLVDRSKEIYRGNMLNFLEWIFVNDERLKLVTPAMRAHLRVAQDRETVMTSENIPTYKFLKEFMKKNDVVPIYFDRLTPELFCKWEKPQEFEKNLAKIYKGLKKRLNERTSMNNQAMVATGKEPLPFRVYNELAKLMLKKLDREFVWGRTFMILGWNLMARSSNTSALLYDHMKYRGDALQFFVIHQKNDRAGGGKKRDPKHVYANPKNPEICPILALGKHHSDASQRVQLMNASDNRRRSVLVLIATSANKSVTSHTDSTQETFLRYDYAADQFVGRVVSGLPLHSPEFAMMPPCFTCPDDESRSKVDSIMETLFPNVSDQLRHIAEQGTASVIFHYDYLKRTLDAKHPVFQTELFAHPTFVETLKMYVSMQDADVYATGIPPHVCMLREISQMKEGFVDSIVNGAVEKLLVAGAGRITQARVEQAVLDGMKGHGRVQDDRMKKCVQKVDRLLNLMNVDRGEAETSPTGRQGQATEATHTRSLDDDSNDSSVMERQIGVEVAAATSPSQSAQKVRSTVTWKMKTRAAWMQWHFGNAEHQSPALKTLKGIDLSSKNDGKRLSDLRFLINHIEAEAKELGIYKETPTWEEAGKIYDQCENYLYQNYQAWIDENRHVPSTRFSHLAWMSMVDIIRKVSKKGKVA